MFNIYDDPNDDIFTGDARRCPRHPHVKTSSDDGVFDGPCGECEAEMDAAANMLAWQEEQRNMTPEQRTERAAHYAAEMTMFRATDNDNILF